MGATAQKQKGENDLHIILTLDDGNGMMFNHRRQSRDRVLLARLVDLVGPSRLLMSPYTAGLFSGGLPAGAEAEEDFLQRAGDEDFCFVEDAALSPLSEKIGTVYVFRWNRVYPADWRLDLDLSGRHMTVEDEFPGSSHEKITLERYDR